MKENLYPDFPGWVSQCLIIYPTDITHVSLTMLEHMRIWYSTAAEEFAIKRSDTSYPKIVNCIDKAIQTLKEIPEQERVFWDWGFDVPTFIQEIGPLRIQVNTNRLVNWTEIFEKENLQVSWVCPPEQPLMKNFFHCRKLQFCNN